MKVVKLTIVLVFFIACSKGKGEKGPAPGPPPDSAQSSGAVLTVMTYNIHHGNPPESPAGVRDMQGIADLIKAQKPDLVSLNEVDVDNKRSGVTLNEAAEIGKLTGMHVFFAKAMDYQGGYYGDAVLSRYPILDSMRYGMSYVLPGSETRDVAMIEIEVDGKKILFASTHLDHLSPEDNRIYQAQYIVNTLIPQLQYPLILAGDLNAEPDSKTISILEGSLRAACSGSGCPLTFPYNDPDATIDYIMFSREAPFSFVSYKAIAGVNVSDHLPLVAKISMENNP